MKNKIDTQAFWQIYSKMTLPMLFVAREDGIILDANKSAQEFLISKQPLSGRCMVEFLNGDWQLFLAWLESQNTADNSPQHFEFHLGNEENRFVEIFYSMIDLDSKPAFFLLLWDVSLQKQIEDDLLAYSQEINLLYKAGEQLSRTLDLNEIYNILFELISNSMDCYSLAVANYDYATQMIRTSYVKFENKSLDAKVISPFFLESQSSPILSEIIEEGLSRRINNFTGVGITGSVEFPVSLRSVIIVPLKLKQEVVGLIQISSTRLEAFSERDQRLLEGLALQVAVAINNALLYHQAQQELTERINTQQRLQHAATHDPLTGLPNRSLFRERVSQALALARRKNAKLAVIILDVDNFRSINDVFSFEFGNQVIRFLSKRVNTLIRENDILASLGGGRFTILLDQIERIEDAAAVAEKLMEEFKRPFQIELKEVMLTFSAGISVFPENGADAEALLTRAEDALSRAKNLGKNTFEYFTEELSEKTQNRLKLMADLRRAVDREEFLVYYQPQVHLGTGEIIGVEALIRWQHPELGFISPGEFIPLAEETRWIVEIGEWVLRQACAQNIAWQKNGYGPFRVSVNISEKQLEKRDFVQRVKMILKETGLKPEHLELELTENVIFRDFAKISDALQELSYTGVRLAVDDFGTGYSSLSHLARFPFNILKIDQRFARNIFTDAKDQAIVSGITGIARNLDIQVIAEGVEIPEQLMFYESLGCSIIQGYYFSRPVSPEKLEELLKWGKYPFA